MSWYADFVNQKLQEREDWVLRRQKRLPPCKRLFVLACMDERLPVEQVLGLQPGDAHIFRNAGGLVTDDAIRSAAISIHFGGVQEIILVLHTECGMLATSGERVTETLEQKLGVRLDEIALDPTLPELRLPRQSISRWWKMQTDIDRAALEQAEALRRHPLIPGQVMITPYVYEVETGQLRRPGQVLADLVRASQYR